MSTNKCSPGARKIAPGDDSFAARFKRAVGKRGTTELAKAVSTAPSTLYRYFDGAIPAADIAIRLARELDVNVEWLIEGVGERQREFAADAEVVSLPVYDPADFDAFPPAEARDQVAVPRALLGALNGASGLWLMQMPSDAMFGVAQEGQMIVCQAPQLPVQDRKVYVFKLDGRVIVRRVSVQPGGLVLRADAEGDTITVRGEDAANLIATARVLGPLGFHPA